MDRSEAQLLSDYNDYLAIANSSGIEPATYEQYKQLIAQLEQQPNHS